jgi:hypothetical protein
MARVFAKPKLKARRGDCRRSGAVESAAEHSGDPPNGGLAMGAIGDVVPTRVILQNRQGIPFVQPLAVEASDQEALNLRESQRGSFF